jgi:hypothetical protein
MKIFRLKVIVFTIFITILLTSGCLDQAKKTGEQIWDAGKKTTQDVYNIFSENIPLYLKNLREFIDDIPIESLLIQPEDPKIVNGIASLPKINDETLNYYERYHSFSDGANAVINIMGREGNMDIGFKGTREEYEKVSKVVSKWTPLIGDYNRLIDSAKTYDKNNDESIKEYYTALGLFCLEMSLIYTHVWWKPTYSIVGSIYRWSGLNRLAFKCPSLIAYILSSAHWGLRSYLTNTTTESAEQLIDWMSKIEVIPHLRRIFNIEN